MSLIRIFVLAAVIYLIYRIIKKKWLMTAPRNDNSGKNQPLLKCTTCGTLTPQESVHTYNGKPFCGTDCLPHTPEGPDTNHPP